MLSASIRYKQSERFWETKSGIVSSSISPNSNKDKHTDNGLIPFSLRLITNIPSSMVAGPNPKKVEFTKKKKTTSVDSQGN